jgi:hypothetical protein
MVISAEGEAAMVAMAAVSGIREHHVLVFVVANPGSTAIGPH